MKTTWNQCAAWIFCAAIVATPTLSAQQRSERSARQSADNAQERTDANPESRRDRDEAVGYLGVTLAPVRSPMPRRPFRNLDRSQGVIVTEVAENSPADKAGIKTNDVLTAFDNEQIVAPMQFVRMVRSTEPGTSIPIEVVQNGQSRVVTVQLAESTRRRESVRNPTIASPPAPEEAQEPRMRPRPRPLLRWLEQLAAVNEDSHWSNFESMTVTNLGQDRFQVEIKFRDEQGEERSYTFEGTRQEIHDSVMGEQHLPASERTHILQAIGMPWAALEADPGLLLFPAELDPWNP